MITLEGIFAGFQADATRKDTRGTIETGGKTPIGLFKELVDNDIDWVLDLTGATPEESDDWQMGDICGRIFRAKKQNKPVIFGMRRVAYQDCPRVLQDFLKRCHRFPQIIRDDNQALVLDM